MNPLHIHSNYSLLEGVITIDEIIDKALSYQLDAVALTDTNAMYGLVSFYKKAKEKNIKPILGAYIDEPGNKNIYAVFLAKNFNGYSDICRIITARKLKDDFSLFKLLQNELANLFILISSLELILKVPAYENIYGELIITNANKLKARKLFQAAKQRNLKYIISNPVYFSEPQDYQLYKVVTAIKKREAVKNLKEEELLDKEFYFKPPHTFDYLKNKLPEAFSNAQFIISQCNVDLDLGKHKVPNFPSDHKHSSFTLLWQHTHEGLTKRYSSIAKDIEGRLEEELQVIDELNLSDYFLIVHDIFLEAKRRGMMTLTRGSAANSLVCYCLGLTEVDPVRYDFYFTRFLNRSRSSLPDIDIDFSWKERDEIVQYVFKKYGYDKVAFISTHVTMKARSAFRETAKVFGFSENEISTISKYIPWTDAKNLPDISKRFPESKSLNFNIEPWKSIINIATKLANFPRHLSIHPGGIVISPLPITTYTALEYAANKGVGLIITQPDMYGVEDLGLVKIDLLSQRSLGVLRDTIQQIRENEYSSQMKNAS
ncbi:MAG TPA: PHP domain-containing protein [Ignavibacteriaceae bacterium]|nr:PHP domain-containing protein [Ignavibacteriaceae bacterium]